MPALNPLTMPVVDPTIAIDGKAMLQLPPAVASANVIVAPTQTGAEPVTGEGGGVIVRFCVTTHPVGNP